MSITTETTRLEFVGDGSDNSPYAISFPLRDDDSVRVIYTTDATGVEVAKTKTTDYTISLADDFTSAELTLVTTAPATGETMSIIRDEPATRLSNYRNFDGQPSSVMDEDYDKSTMSDQTLQEQLDRAIVVSRGHPDTNLPLTPLTLKGNGTFIIAVNAGETGFELLENGILDGTISPDKLLDGSADNQVIQYNSGLGEWEYRSALTIDGTTALNDDVVVTGGLLTVNSDTDGTTILGRAKIGTIVSDVAAFAHFGHLGTSGAAISQTALGLVKVNAPTGQEVGIAINGTAELVVDVTNVTIATNALILTAGNLVVTAGTLTVGSTITAGSGATVLTTAAGLLRHQAIDPAIAGAGLSVATGVLSVNGSADITTLTDNSMADTLHRHSELSASDGTPDANFSLDAAGEATLGVGDLIIATGGLDVTSGKVTIADAGPAGGYSLTIGDVSSSPDADAGINVVATPGSNALFSVKHPTASKVGSFRVYNDVNTRLGVDVFGSGTGSPSLVALVAGTAAGTDPSEFRLNIQGPGFMSFYTNNTERMRLTTGGDFSIGTGTLTVNSDADGTTILGRAKIGTIAADVAAFAHFGHLSTSGAALSQTATGLVKVNAPTGQEVGIAINGTNELVIDATNVTIATNNLVLTAGGLTVTAGNIVAPNAGNKFSIGAAASGAIMIQGVSSVSSVLAAFFTRNVATSTQPVVKITQDHTGGATVALAIQQDDISEGFIDFLGSDLGVVATSTGDSAASVRVELNGTKYIVPLFTDV